MLSTQEEKAEYFFDTIKKIVIPGEDLVELIRSVIIHNQKQFRFKVKGFSMLPFIKDKDVVVLSPISSSPGLGLGDVAAFIHPGSKKLTIHRIVKSCKNHCLIKGDNSLFIDGCILKKDILARVSKVERGKKRVSIGLGPERLLIAFLSRKQLLFTLSTIFRLIKRVVL